MVLKSDVALIISDLHVPYEHPDAYAFLLAIKKEYEPDLIINIGDEVDKHALSFHDSDPDLASAGDELKKSQKILKKYARLFPEMWLIDSNHGSLGFRRAKAMGMPKEYLKGYGEVLKTPDTWRWTDELTIKSGENHIIARHQWKKNPLICSQQMGACVLQGHFHESFDIQYASSPSKLLWAMTVGCLIDKQSLAFAYSKTNTKRPIIGVGLIIDGHPRLIPMVLNKRGRWKGFII